MGARSKRSKDRPFFSNVIVTDSRLVVPNKTDMATTPGSNPIMLSSPCPDLMKNMPVHARGKIMPQLILGGLR